MWRTINTNFPPNSSHCPNSHVCQFHCRIKFPVGLSHFLHSTATMRECICFASRGYNRDCHADFSYQLSGSGSIVVLTTITSLVNYSSGRTTSCHNMPGLALFVPLISILDSNTTASTSTMSRLYAVFHASLLSNAEPSPMISMTTSPNGGAVTSSQRVSRLSFPFPLSALVFESNAATSPFIFMCTPPANGGGGGDTEGAYRKRWFHPDRYLSAESTHLRTRKVCRALVVMAAVKPRGLRTSIGLGLTKERS